MSFPRRDETRPVTRVRTHPEADLAIIETEPDEEDSGEGYPRDSFVNFVGNLSLGEDFLAYGFPSEGPDASPGSAQLVPRLFKGHYQRYFPYEMSGYKYLAGEMNVAAPQGLSGGPVFRPGAFMLLTGTVTANQESYVTVDSFEGESEEARLG